MLFGLIPLLTGLFFLIRNMVYARKGYITKGEVISITHHPTNTTNYTPYPVIRFKNQMNQSKELIMTSSLPMRGPTYSKGEWVDIVYYKDKIYPIGITWTIIHLVFIFVGLGIIMLQFKG